MAVVVVCYFHIVNAVGHISHIVFMEQFHLKGILAVLVVHVNVK